jgi:hypothetical protein
MTKRMDAAIGIGFVWAGAAVAITALLVALATDRPSGKGFQDTDGVIRYRNHSPAWPLVFCASGPMGIVAGFAGATWRYTRPEVK